MLALERFMNFKKLIILFGLLSFRQASAGDVTSLFPSGRPGTEAGVCSVCVKAEVKPVSLPDLGNDNDDPLSQLKNNMAQLLKSKQGGSISGRDVIRVATKPQLLELEQKLKNSWNVDFVDDSGVLTQSARTVDYNQKVSDFMADPQNQLQNPDAEFKKTFSGRAIGMHYGSTAVGEKKTGLRYDMSVGQQIFHFHGGAFVKGSILQKLSRESEVTGDLSVQSDGERSLTVNYKFHFN